MPLTTFLADLLAEGRFVGIDSGNRILGMSIWLAGLLFTSLASVPSMFAQGRRAMALQRAWFRRWSPAPWSSAPDIAWICPATSLAERHPTGQRARSRARSDLSPEGRRGDASLSGGRATAATACGAHIAVSS